MVGKRPVRPVESAAGCRLGWKRGDEDRHPAGRDPPPVEVINVDVVVAEQVSLDRVAMGG